MAKNSYVLDCERRIKALKDRVVIDSAYIGAGFIITLFNKGFSDDEICDIMEEVNKTWTELRDKHINPMQYCFDKTGFEVITEEQEKQIIEEYFKEG